MRIPVKASYKGYLPTLDLFTKELVWIKTNRKNIGINNIIIWCGAILFMTIGMIWSKRVDERNYDSSWMQEKNLDDPNRSGVNVYFELGHNKFVAFFIIAVVAGIILYLSSLFIYNSQKHKIISSKESILMYKKSPLFLEDENFRKQMNIKISLKWSVPLTIVILLIGFSSLFLHASSGVFPGGLFGSLLAAVSYCVYIFLYYITVLISRRYLDRKFNIKPRKK